MIFKPSTWYPIAVALSVLNLVAIGLYWRPDAPGHAAIHAVVALGFGLWARRLRQTPSPASASASELSGRFEALDDEVTRLRQELTETQERLDFAERLLAQAREKPRVGPERQD